MWAVTNTSSLGGGSVALTLTNTKLNVGLYTAPPQAGQKARPHASGNNIWIASEYIGQSCSLSQYENTVFRCNNARTALANWGRRMSEIAIPTQ